MLTGACKGIARFHSVFTKFRDFVINKYMTIVYGELDKTTIGKNLCNIMKTFLFQFLAHSIEHVVLSYLILKISAPVYQALP